MGVPRQGLGFRKGLGSGVTTPIVENQTEKKMKNEMETAVWSVRFRMRVEIWGIRLCI